MGRPSNTDERRLQILTAMIRVMARRGYDGAAIGEIAKAAHLTAGLVHYHFKSKEEILLAALDFISAAHLARLDQAIAQAGGQAVEEVGAFIDVHLGLGTYADPEALACWNLLSGEALRNRKVRERFERALAQIVRRLAASIRRGQEQWEFSCDDVDAAAAALVATVQGYFVMGASARSTIPKGSAARSTRKMAEGLLKPVHPLSREAKRS
ncbi:MAG TPA: TetR/AcrR family transcriptional regulator [Myxococcales bacterium]